MSKKQTLTEELFRIHEMMGLTENQLDMFDGTEDEAPSEDSHIGKRVMVYFNLHKKTFSIQYKGLVIAHADYVKLKNVEFRVRQGGKEKVRAEMSKNVHAFVIGDLVEFIEYPATDIPSATSSKSITYDPYKYDSFVYRDTEEPVTNAREVEMINQPGGKIFQINEIARPLKENRITYDPSKIDEFVLEAKKDVELGNNLMNKFGTMLVNTPLISIYENLDRVQEAHQKIVNSEKYLRSKFDKYFDIVEMYYSIDEDRPKNVDELDDLSNKVDDLSYRLSDLGDGLEAFIELVERISRHNEQLFKTENIQ